MAATILLYVTPVVPVLSHDFSDGSTQQKLQQKRSVKLPG